VAVWLSIKIDFEKALVEESPSTRVLNLRIDRDLGSGLVARFTTKSISEPLQIFDMIGQPVLKMPVESGMKDMILSSQSLPPGCYFARLGNEVVKFVVMP